MSPARAADGTTPARAPRTAPPAPAADPPPPTAFALLGACHPVPAAAVTLFTAALAAAVGRTLPGAALTVAAVASGQLSVGWSNDRVDLGRDLATGRRDKPLASGAVRPAAVTAATLTALLLCVPLSLATGWLAGCAHLCGVAAAWAYNLRLKSTAVSWLPYALAFGLLPAFVTLGLPGAPWPPWWLTAAAALLGTGAHFANVLPDIEDDLATGVVGLPHRIGARRSAAVGGLLVLGSAVALVAGPPGRVPAYGWGLLAATAAVVLVGAGRRTGRSRIPFLVTMAVAAGDVVLLLVRGAALTGMR
ncbi:MULTISPECIES: UbiA family prenyltransferase [unclassified Streptomyces]|uniref:UbiA family prenyltransferase n=1 Tax=unclassified Streptomyces TaxID=2593676 RepID=UPI002E0FD60A|nr:MULTISPECIES: UbiA family prenyltransferase [unclassified Streptomyces]WSR22761.1 UbiA family prenyltransferase [Streptomyces sp. NBC_01205]